MGKRRPQSALVVGAGSIARRHLNYQPYYCDRFGNKRGEFPVAEDGHERLISLPMFHAMTERTVEDVIQAITKVTAHYAK